jgi:hypothetical protein
MFATILNTSSTIFATVAKAEAVAASNRALDPDWTYTVVPNTAGTGANAFTAIVAVYDEDGNFVANL